VQYQQARYAWLALCIVLASFLYGVVAAVMRLALSHAACLFQNLSVLWPSRWDFAQ
jgi:hypothetical protein